MNSRSILTKAPNWRLPASRRRVTASSVVLGFLALCGVATSASAGDQAPEVVIHQAAVRDVQPVLEFPTRIRAGEDIKIIPRVEGNLLERNFNSGDAVKKGDQLYLIQPKPFEIALDQRKAALDQARANLKLAKQSVDRAEVLTGKKAVAQQTLDEYRANYDKAVADVTAAEKAVERATLELGHTRITAKADGVISNEEVAIGDLVGPTRGSLGTLDVVDSVRAYIHVDEKLDTAYYERELAGDKAEFDIRLLLPTGSVHAHSGSLEAYDNRIDPTTGTRTIKLLFPNPDGLLTPGMSATVLVTETTAGGNLAIPQQAVQQDQLGHYVLVVREDNSLEQRHLVLGAQVGTWWLVKDNLKAGERIVVEGLQQVRPGVTVTPMAESPVSGSE